jgi:hypothetical protein
MRRAQNRRVQRTALFADIVNEAPAAAKERNIFYALDRLATPRRGYR